MPQRAQNPARRARAIGICAAIGLLLLAAWLAADAFGPGETEPPRRAELGENAEDGEVGAPASSAAARERSVARQDAQAVPPPPGGASMEGRLLDADRRDVCRQALRAKWGERTAREAAETNHEGRFCIAFDGPLPAMGERLVLALVDEADPAAEVFTDEREIPAVAPGTRVDLGEWVLPPWPLAAAGIVLDDRDRPVADARVSAELFASERTVRTRSDGAGRFALRAREPRGPLRVRAELDLHEGLVLSGLVAGTPAALELRLVLSRAATLEGRVRLPLRVAPSAVQVRIDLANAAPICLPLDLAGRFAVHELRAGRVELRWLGPSTDEKHGERVSLDSVTTVELALGETTTLAPRDLGAALRAHEYLLRDRARGGVLVRSEVRVLSLGPEGETRTQVLRSEESGRLAFALEADAQRAVIVALGFRAQPLDLAGTPDWVELAFVPPIEVALGIRFPEEPPDLSRVIAEVVARDEDPLAIALGETGATRALGWSGSTLNLLVERPGAYRLTLLQPAGVEGLRADFTVDEAGAATPATLHLSR